ncbi:PREDICTED: platelet-activating factor acetylhydrolase [Chinchilla lanigera]|uniref:Platelet-activating factor acetylhydrolase n=1 Tax=Chinchilla lanigera TaxID=34839 RepID=A0A8C2VHZ4_CHILA|nr:PREDICTED: platelet-activating factor acetylhydrolase [Chinchilla lanigera]XP_005389922.1 PREDICTED: platelet-activating factor acetylhydrolase [Chinchilla lanigera]XP_013372551.1 PREDICTED: platelet-activating factor acetylhydrolase [Chinchilla lanigera]XP_013372552.1 PREDICTED: platelet-activating factor acetylhydrolase [Chinchilla lanigera]XP_013372553.1 PREDICTED: platelet-activating factor acetylhydrolase [Chinchilla lanigera]
MAPPKLHMLFCLSSCLVLVHPLERQAVTPVTHTQSAWIPGIQSLLPTESFHHTVIPKGSGPYSVGCTDLMSGYTNQSTFLRLYYPSQDEDFPEALWIPNKEYFLGISKVLGSPSILGKVLSALYGSKTVPAKWNSPLRTGEKYPLIIFSHGLGAFRTIYSAIGIELASHGFIVAAVEHRDESAAATYYFQDETAAESGNKSWLYFKSAHVYSEMLRKEQVQQRAEECSQALTLLLNLDEGKPVENVLDLQFDLQQLKGSLDRNKTAIIGHSFGGATVIQVLSEDKRFRCGIALDPWMFPLGEEVHSKICQPLFFINSEYFQSDDDIAKLKKFYQPHKERKMIAVRGSLHHNFVDFTFAPGNLVGQWLSLKGKIDSKVAMDIFNRASLAFLQKYLGLDKNFDQWNSLMEGDDENLILEDRFDVVTLSTTLQSSTETEKGNLR